MKHKIICILVLALFLGSCSQDPASQEYMPLVLDNREGFVEDPTLLTKAHVDRVEHVLRFYDVEFDRVSDTRLGITNCGPRSFEKKLGEPGILNQGE